MRKIQYKFEVVVAPAHSFQDVLMKRLNELGAEGWDVSTMSDAQYSMSAVELGSHQQALTRILLKRETPVSTEEPQLLLESAEEPLTKEDKDLNSICE